MTNTISRVTAVDLNRSTIGEEAHAVASELFPICRSITGGGVRETLAIIGRYAPLSVTEVPTGQKVLDWTVPREWTIRDAYIAASDGRKVVDFRDSNLHIVNYSSPVRARMSLTELKPYLHTLPDRPDLIPYQTSYYNDKWGFCLRHRDLEALAQGDYDVVIDCDLKDGSLTLGEFVHQGSSEKEVVINAHTCHPSLAMECCAGLAILSLIGRELSRLKTRWTYRFVFAPSTIGGITWLALNEDRLAQIEHGLVVACLGTSGGPTYKKSRRGDAMIDRAMTHILRHAGPTAEVREFSPAGYDERQFCSPGFNLPFGLLQRTPTREYAEYHTSADHIDAMRPADLAISYDLIAKLIEILENDCAPVNLRPKGEPRLGHLGLYSAADGDPLAADRKDAIMWVLNLADGRHSLLNMAERSDLPFGLVLEANNRLLRAGLLAAPE